MYREINNLDGLFFFVWIYLLRIRFVKVIVYYDFYVRFKVSKC